MSTHSTPAGEMVSGTTPLGGFAISPEGALEPLPGERPALRFRWRGRACTAGLAAGSLELLAEAGRVPSTAEPGAPRVAALAAVRALPGELPAGWRLDLRPDHRVGVAATATLDGPATATVLVTALVRFALRLDPYLAKLEAAGVGDAFGKSGA